MLKFRRRLLDCQITFLILMQHWRTIRLNGDMAKHQIIRRHEKSTSKVSIFSQHFILVITRIYLLTISPSQNQIARSSESSQSCREPRQELGSRSLFQTRHWRLAHHRSPKLYLLDQRRSSPICWAYAQSRNIQCYHHPQWFLWPRQIRLCIQS